MCVYEKDVFSLGYSSGIVQELLRLQRQRERGGRRVLRLDGSVAEEDANRDLDIRHSEFLLSCDMRALVDSVMNRSVSLQDINVMKFILVSGLYPNIAFPDDLNASRPMNDQSFHTRHKAFLALHPTCTFFGKIDVGFLPVSLRLHCILLLPQSPSPECVWSRMYVHVRVCAFV